MFTRCQTSKDIFASGGFADIREGKLKGKVVAIKTIRTSLETKVDEVLEVRKPAVCPGSSTDQHNVPDSDLLQGMRPLDEHIPP